jgi:endonuclease YncB( thermonuclease family)
MSRVADATLLPRSNLLICAMARAGFVTLCSAWLSTSGFEAWAQVPCAGETAGNGIVASVVDGRSFRLADGREIRLAGIDVPMMPRAGGPSPAATDARTALETMINGREITLKFAARETDRYGRVLAYAFVNGQAVQNVMLAQGHARLSSGAGACRAEMLAQEAKARSAKLGLWASSELGVQDAAIPAKIAAQRGHFAIVEGKVLSVRPSGATIYMNFGRRWIEGFAVTIRRRDERAFAAAGLTPKSLEGKRIRVRGIIDERPGPRIEALLPEQIEVVDVN